LTVKKGEEGGMSTTYHPVALTRREIRRTKEKGPYDQRDVISLQKKSISTTTVGGRI